MLNKLLINQNSTLIFVLSAINDNEMGIVFTVDDEKKLTGTITDGDVRRALLDGASLDDIAEKYSNKNFTYAPEGKTTEELIEIVEDGKTIIPLVDENMKVVDYFQYSTNLKVPVAAPLLKGNEFKYLTDAFLSSWISSTGKYITDFENNFSSFIGTQYGAAVSNGTAALHLGLLALDIGPGDEVIVPDFTFAATINSVLHAGATPVIVDVEEDSWCIDPQKIKEAITEKTKAIICVHIFGQPCDMDSITKLCEDRNLYLIEDCAQAHGAEYNGKKVGSFGDVSCFSFFGNKIITTGEGGICLTQKKSIYDKITILRDHGMTKEKRYWHDVVGYNYRMTNLQASIGVAQLEKIHSILENRSKIEEKYREIFSKVPDLKSQKVDIKNTKKVTWLVCATTENREARDAVIASISKIGIDSRPFFYALSSMPLYKEYIHSNEVSNKISNIGLSFPTITGLDEEYFKKLEENLTRGLNNL
ncbi:MAG: aminotransferase class I/II-fold pyridoxal phosphate-dependent enzyme [Bdellovibrionota bacterium]|nr:aminotransferase class I/II-fold pyridoxal phosphate-dependent enzyme [Bdellovibrionota bacterium]